MSLATQCPHCKTIFRVAQDQLKLRAGLVRCGACSEIFNGIEHLLAADVAPDQPISPQTSQAEPEQPSPPAPSATLDFAYPEFELPEVFAREPVDSVESIDSVEFVEVPRVTPTAPEQADIAHNLPEDVRPPIVADENQEHASTEIADSEPFLGEIESSMEAFAPDPDIPAALPVIEEGLEESEGSESEADPHVERQATESLEPLESTEAEEPDFVKQGRRKQRLGRTLRIAALSVSLILLLGALGQAAYAFREQIAAHAPETKPALLAACSFLHCKIGLPTQIENISIESNQLETLGANKDDSELTMLLRNMSTTAQAWPHIELTLNDANGSLLARRVFTPRDYVSNVNEIAQGLAGNSEQTVKIHIEYSAAKPAGYRVGVFYP